jgi:hypothetical protein
VSPVVTPEPGASRSRPRPVNGRRVAIALGVFLVLGTVIATTAAMYGHELGAVARERYEAAGRR